MRELKFRVWDKNYKWMEEVDGDCLFVADGEIYEVTEESRYYQTYMEKKIVTDKYELMQFTGLVDKNGKEIYEGDIVLLVSSNVPLKVAFVEGSYKIVNMKHLTDNLQLLGGTQSFLEVVGNIYENPDISV